MDNSRFWWQAAGVDPGPGPGPNDPGDPIGQSLRFRGAQYLASPILGSTDTYTVSTWIKLKIKNSSNVQLSIPFGSSNGSTYFVFYDEDNGYFPGMARYWLNNALAWDGSISQRKYQDPSAWYHLVVQVSAAGTKVFINGEQDPTVGSQVLILMAPFRVGAESSLSAGWMMHGYMAGFYLIDGQALDPTTFGRFNANGVWVPVDPKKDGDTAWYGTNGFHLTFADPNDIGKDYSGNGNDFTATGFELADTTSPTYDLMQDSPTQNFATLNPLLMSYTQSAGTHQSEANLKHTNSASNTVIKYGPTIQFPDIDQVFLAVQINVNNSYGHALGFYKSINDDIPDYRTDRTTGLWGTGGNWSILQNGTVGAAVTWNVDDWLYFAYDRVNTRMRMWINDTMILDDTAADNDYTCFYNIPYNFKGYTYNFGQQPYAHNVDPFSGGGNLVTSAMPAANLPDEITGTFTGNNNADGPFVYTGCIPGRIQYGTVDVTYDQRLGQTNVDFLSNGFKVRSTTSNSGTVNYTVTTTHTGGEYDGFKVPFQSPAPAVSN